MERILIEARAARRLPGTIADALAGVVASGNLEVLAERIGDDTLCRVEIETASHGFAEIWRAVVADFVERCSPGGVRLSINDGGARPDAVMLRLMQAARLLEGGA